MIIDRSHRGWIILTSVLFVISCGLYAWYCNQAPNGPRGGSWQGLAYGVAGTLLMLFCGLFTVRKKLPGLRWLGTAQGWLRAHIWLGLLSIPLILFHAGFRTGGALEQGLLLVLLLILISGIWGVVVQHKVPGMMRSLIQQEVMQSQTSELCRRLTVRADSIIVKHCGSLFLEDETEDMDDDDRSKGRMRSFYIAEIRPYLKDESIRNSRFSNEVKADVLLSNVKNTLLPEQQLALAELKKIIVERREVELQSKFFRSLHEWLTWHVPLSYTLLVLTIAHIVMALWY